MINLYCRPEEVTGAEVSVGDCIAASAYIDELCGWRTLLRSPQSLVFHSSRLASRLPLVSVSSVEEGHLDEEGYVWHTADTEDYNIDAISRRYWGHQPFLRITGEWGWGFKSAYTYDGRTDMDDVADGSNFFYSGKHYYSDGGVMYPAIAGQESDITQGDNDGFLLEPEYTINTLAIQLSMILHWKRTDASMVHGKEADRWMSNTAQGFSVMLRKYRRDAL